MAAFDAVAFAMGKAGMSRDVVSALMGGNGGGGSGTLEESGWVKQIEGSATVSGNRITLSSGNVTHSVRLAPPDASFAVGDELVVALTVVENWQQLNISGMGTSKANMTITTGFVQRSTYNEYCRGTGNDVITWTMKKTSNYFYFSPVTNTSGGSEDAYATIDITGIKYNGTVIFGKV